MIYHTKYLLTHASKIIFKGVGSCNWLMNCPIRYSHAFCILKVIFYQESFVILIHQYFCWLVRVS